MASICFKSWVMMSNCAWIVLDDVVLVGVCANDANGVPAITAAIARETIKGDFFIIIFLLIIFFITTF